jgi:homoserine dehydrogenase
VGAGLPVLSTLQSMINTGDKVQKIEGIFSGTLSFIFNNFGPGRPFSDVVSKAKAAGYTEPDPREDLSGGRNECSPIKEPSFPAHSSVMMLCPNL